MQINSVYLYPNSIDVYSNVPGEWLTERYRRVYNRNLKLIRGANNTVDLQVRNTDQKPIAVSDSTVVFNLIGRDQKLIISKDCTAISADTGKFSVTITESELFNLEAGFYNYSLYKTGDTGVKTPLYIDSQYGTNAVVEITGGIQGNPVESLEVNKFFYINPATTGDTGADYYTSSLIDAQYQTTSPNSNHTFAVYGTNYVGTAEIHGSIDEGGTPTHWTTLETISFASEPIQYTNIVGKWRWFRIKHIPDTLNTGSVDKVLYR